ncbi:MAG TPA: protein-methionine-sulfoxide reductase heme-binding subunit MsrQ [Terriglobales bacterium]|nr:protein-methionine-sulfoxide reductase heme-binding subunit MsrQ [Terriglobales bacterium]
MGQGVLLALALLPAAWLAYAACFGGLGANPVETVTHVSGEWALRLLLASLAITPLRRLSRWSWLIRYRRTLGLLAFAYVCLHLATFVAFDHFFDWRGIIEDIAKRPYITAGFAGFVCLVPLAITSTGGWIRRLGRNWQRLHRLAYLAAICGVVHYYWLVKADVTGPGYYAAVLAVLLVIRPLSQRADAFRRRMASAPRRRGFL